MQGSFFTTSSLNGVLLPTPRSQVTIFNKHEELFFEIVPCDSELNGRLTTSFLNGVQSADPRYSLNKRQNMRNYFAVCFSNTQVKTLISQPLFIYVLFHSFCEANRAACMPACRPKIMISATEFPPIRLSPCKPPVTSPAAYNPLIG